MGRFLLRRLVAMLFAILALTAIVFFLLVGLLPSYVALVAAFGGGLVSWLLAIVALVPYILYTWLIWPSVPYSLARELFGVRGWAKTSREPLDANLPKGALVEADGSGPVAIEPGVAAEPVPEAEPETGPGRPGVGTAGS